MYFDVPRIRGLISDAIGRGLMDHETVNRFHAEIETATMESFTDDTAIQRCGERVYFHVAAEREHRAAIADTFRELIAD